MFEINEKQRSYMIAVVALSLFIFFLVTNLLGGTQDPVISYLLSLIASNSIVKEVKDIK